MKLAIVSVGCLSQPRVPHMDKQQQKWQNAKKESVHVNHPFVFGYRLY